MIFVDLKRQDILRGVWPKSLMINTVPSSGISSTFGGESLWIRLSRAPFEVPNVTRRRSKGRLAIVAIRFARSRCVSSGVEVMCVAERRIFLLLGLSVNVRGDSWFLNRMVPELSAVIEWICRVGSWDVGKSRQICRWNYFIIVFVICMCWLHAPLWSGHSSQNWKECTTNTSRITL